MARKRLPKRTERQAKNLANVRAINWRLRELEGQRRNQNHLIKSMSMPGLTDYSREQRLMWALNTLFFNPCKNISQDAFLGAVQVLESYDRYYANPSTSEPKLLVFS
jgi:hypothetical protein